MIEGALRDLSLVAVLAGGLRAAVPLYLAAVGEVFSERAGIINVGIEGIMLIGAMMAVATQVESGSGTLGIVAATAAGGAMAFVFACVTILARANQIAAGIALIFLCKGVSALIGKPYVGQQITGLPQFRLPLLADLPIIGPIFMHQDVVAYLTVVSIPLLTILLYNSRYGLLVRAVGDDPSAAERAGVAVIRVRLVTVVLGGCCAGLAGGYLSLSYARTWKEEMVAGRGLIALALAIFAAWKPVRTAFGALLFGTLTALQLRLQAVGIDVSPYLLDMAPYLLALVALIVATKRSGLLSSTMPRALGRTYNKGET